MQKSKKIIIAIALAFLVAVIVSFFLVFSINKVETEFFSYGDSSAQEIQKDLNKYNGKIILFVNESDVRAVCDGYPYYEITSVEKKMPNVLSVRVEKRKEVLRVHYGEKTLVLDGNGIILNDVGTAEMEQDIIDLYLDGVTVSADAVGNTIELSNKTVFFTLIEAVKTSAFRGVVKEIKMVCATEKNDLEFSTYTGVKIVVWDADSDCEQKINKAIELYSSLNDYEKSCSEIVVYYDKVADGIKAVWEDPDDID